MEDDMENMEKQTETKMEGKKAGKGEFGFLTLLKTNGQRNKSRYD